MKKGNGDNKREDRKEDRIEMEVKNIGNRGIFILSW